MTLSNQDIARLVEEDRVHRRVYTDPAIFDLEMERIWGGTWIYVGHDSQVKEPGDYFSTTIGRQAVIMVRHKDRDVKVLYNRCAHKGAALVSETSGHVDHVFRCCLHGWCFNTDGTNAFIPVEEGYYGTRLEKGDPCRNVQQVARVGLYRGFVFASLSPEVPDLEDWLGPAKSSIDNMVDRAPEGELEVTGGVQRYMHDSNWKFFIENLNDLMHPMVVHDSSSRTAKITAKKLLPADEPTPTEVQILAPFTEKYSFYENMGLIAFENGHSYSGVKMSIHSAYSDIEAYNEAMIEAYGEQRAKEILSENRHNTVFYPSATIKGAIQTLRLVKPIAVDKTLIESYTFRLKGAPEELLERSILYCNLINSPAHLVGPDDQEAYHRQQIGLSSNGNDWVSMHRHLGGDEQEQGGWTATGTSDMVFRRQFKAWKGYMTEAAS